MKYIRFLHLRHIKNYDRVIFINNISLISKDEEDILIRINSDNIYIPLYGEDNPMTTILKMIQIANQKGYCIYDEDHIVESIYDPAMPK